MADTASKLQIDPLATLSFLTLLQDLNAERREFPYTVNSSCRMRGPYICFINLCAAVHVSISLRTQLQMYGTHCQ